MASIIITLDKRRATENVNYPAKVVFNNNKTNASLSLNIELPEKAWFKNGSERPVKVSHCNELNIRIFAGKLAELSEFFIIYIYDNKKIALFTSVLFVLSDRYSAKS